MKRSDCCEAKITNGCCMGCGHVVDDNVKQKIDKTIKKPNYQHHQKPFIQTRKKTELDQIRSKQPVKITKHEVILPNPNGYIANPDIPRIKVPQIPPMRRL